MTTPNDQKFSIRRFYLILCQLFENDHQQALMMSLLLGATAGLALTALLYVITKTCL
ncbi:hypothetical protein [Maritalea sp.]|uniref:hypothetical protein n=1 Tax=Maritalea sp. TaxID=2003361 RepID=UPI003EF66327